MKKVTATLLMACIALLSASCKKNTYVPPSINITLIAATYTATRIEGSNTNNGTDWVDFTKAGAREVLIINADKTFNSTVSNPATGAATTPITGTWSLSSDGKTLSYVGIQDYTVAYLTTTSLITVLKGPNKLANADATVYAYYRFTYARQ